MPLGRAGTDGTAVEEVELGGGVEELLGGGDDVVDVADGLLEEDVEELVALDGAGEHVWVGAQYLAS